MIHQDVKPLNALMWDDGTLKVTDFGLAGAREAAHLTLGRGDGHTMSVEGSGGYTPAYCSPEQLKAGNLNRRTDVWSWGLSVLAMFHGGAHWSQENIPTGPLATKILETFLEHNTVQERETDLTMEGIPLMPEGVARLLERCFLENSDERPRTLEECAQELAEVYSTCVGQAYTRPAPRAAEDSAATLNNRAVSLVDLGKQEEALALWDEALAKHPGHLQATYNLGLILWRKGQETDTGLLAQLAEFESAASDDPVAPLHVGHVHIERADYRAAIEAFKRAEERSGGEEAKWAMAQAEALLPREARCVRSFLGHEDKVNSVCLSSDGRWAMSGSSDNTLRLWDVSSGSCVRTFLGHSASVYSVCLSLDGHWALSGSGYFSMDRQVKDQTLRLWDVSSGRCVRTFKGHFPCVTSVCLSENGHWAVAVNFSGKTFPLFDASSGKCVRTFKGHEDHINSACLSADGRWALSGSSDNTLRLWDTSNGRCVRKFEGHTGWVNSVCLSADGTLGLSGSHDGTLRLWDITGGGCIQTFEGHSSKDESVYMSADGRWAISGGGHTLRLWDLSNGRCVRTLKGPSGSIESLCMSADGHWVLFGKELTLQLWDISAITMGHLRPKAPLALCRIASVAQAVLDSDVLKAALDRAKQNVNSRNWSGALAAVREARSVQIGERNREALDLWHSVGLKGVRKSLRAGWHFRTVEGHLGKAHLSADGRWALSMSPDGTPHLWDFSSGRTIRTFGGHSLGVTNTCLSADGRWAMAGCYTGDICLGGEQTLSMWDATSGGYWRTFKGHTDIITTVCLSVNGRWALSGSKDFTLCLWDTPSGRCFHTFKGHFAGVSSACFSADGCWALSGSEDQTLRLWEVSSGQCVLIFKGHTNRVSSVSLSADRHLALSGSWDGTLRLWDVSNGRCLRILKGHTHRVNSVCMSVDGRWALSGSDDKTLRVWEVSSGRCVRTFKGHAGSVYSVSLTADGRYAVSWSSDKTLRLWELDWNYEDHEPADWDEGARPYLENFLKIKGSWTAEDFEGLLHTLACAGYGWVKSQGVRRELQDMWFKAEEERKRREAEAWNRSLLGRMTYFFTGKKK